MRIKNNLIVEALCDGGCLVVDQDTQRTHALKPEAAAVWRQLEAARVDPSEIAGATGLSEAQVVAAMAQLAALGLIEADEVEDRSRRQLLARAATIAGAAASLKLIESIATPSPAAAQSAMAREPA